MGKISRGIKTGLQLNHKWVRVMLIISIVVIAGILIYPNGGMMRSKTLSEYQPMSEPIMDTTITIADSSTARLIVRPLSRPPLGVPVPETIIEDNKTKSGEPLQVQIVETDKPFDWKSTLSWIIGAINGLVLLVMNLKNIFKKT